MLNKIIFIATFISLVACVERDVYRVKRHEVIEQVGIPAPAVVTETEVITRPEAVIVPERIIRRPGRRVVERVYD